MIFRRLRRILAAENADYTSIAYFPALFKSEFRRKSESVHRYIQKGCTVRKPYSLSKESLVRVTGLEPAHLAAQEPKSCVSANFTTPAYLLSKVVNIIQAIV